MQIIFPMSTTELITLIGDEINKPDMVLNIQKKYKYGCENRRCYKFTY